MTTVKVVGTYICCSGIVAFNKQQIMLFQQSKNKIKTIGRGRAFQKKTKACYFFAWMIKVPVSSCHRLVFNHFDLYTFLLSSVVPHEVVKFMWLVVFSATRASTLTFFLNLSFRTTYLNKYMYLSDSIF